MIERGRGRDGEREGENGGEGKKGVVVVGYT